MTVPIGAAKPPFFWTHMNNLKRLYLLSDAEIDDLYTRPIFNHNERLLYFEMNQGELNALDQFGTLKTKMYFILQLAYFKAKRGRKPEAQKFLKE